MSVYPEDYNKRVLDDVRSYEGLFHPVKAGALERITVKKSLLSNLHPNPEDEFSMAEVGPSFEIVSNYVEQFKQCREHGQDPFVKDRLVVEKMSTGGYLLLNGHHRWFAAGRIGIKKARIQIVNVTHEDDILKIVNKSENDKCISFDLDEVLLTDGVRVPLDHKLKFPLNKLYTQSLRKNAGELLTELQKLGYDVWIYTGHYHSDQYINGLLKLHKTSAHGIVNGLGRKNSNVNIKKIFTEKYKLSVHVDNESITCVNTTTRDDYEIIDLNTDGASWSADVLKALRSFDESRQDV